KATGRGLELAETMVGVSQAVPRGRLANRGSQLLEQLHGPPAVPKSQRGSSAPGQQPTQVVEVPGLTGTVPGIQVEPQRLPSVAERVGETLLCFVEHAQVHVGERLAGHVVQILEQFDRALEMR